jgi:hypothetical protein
LVKTVKESEKIPDFEKTVKVKVNFDPGGKVGTKIEEMAGLVESLCDFTMREVEAKFIDQLPSLAAIKLLTVAVRLIPNAPFIFDGKLGASATKGSVL